MGDKMFSILCLTYNHSAYIHQCVKSVLSQTYDNWELLILDDGSTDGTGETITPFLDDTRIKYFHQENKGAGCLAENYNFLLGKAIGNYITILEGDDYAEPELLAKHNEALKQNTKAVLSFNRVRVADPGHEWESPRVPVTEKQKQIFSNTPIGYALNELFLGCFIPAQGVTLKRDDLVHSGGFEKVEGLATVDYPTWLKLVSLGTFVFIPETLATWRRHVSQSTKQRIVPLTQLMLPVYERVYDELTPEVLKHVFISKKKVTRHWAIKFTKIIIRGGNYQLQAKHWKEGRRLYFQSFQRWPAMLPIWRMKAVLGIVFSWIHIPWMHWYHFVPERISKLF